MKTITAKRIEDAVYQLCVEAASFLPRDVMESLEKARAGEKSPLGREMLDCILENAAIAANERQPICQDTGLVVVFVRLGRQLCLEDSLEEAVNAGVARAYHDAYLRKSIVAHPLNRQNTGDNTPAVVHVRLVPGDKMHITVCPKGFGSENMGGVAMLKPAQGQAGVVDYVLSVVDQAGANPCPPIIVGVGLGGTMEYAALLAKEALLRPVGQPAANKWDQQLEQELLEKINGLGIGPQGLGGTQTALAVHVNSYPTHIAGLPVAVNLNCHAARHAETELEGE